MPLPNTQKATAYEHVPPLLAYLEESEDIDGVLFPAQHRRRRRGGGACHRRAHFGNEKKPTVSLVLGGGHSIGVPLAVRADGDDDRAVGLDDHSPVRTSGTIIATPQTYQY